ncbi:Membrane protein involved in the export of O-antigen and teichoic acid [Pseudobutyrivibrio sp. OR37]|uniref:lipopolysaccharide biosynthesis protein n=1 Tax=Pseudobutyrivibrio sp. OR37 TaxID=1798186 RepID=UPI0008E8577C|nr:hypothetical protein [Pseudobutyrivibrio sp. OR37]SFI04041.1 Membrane protein involved in the export of O-antigen and teichoic acid [Pseudobutyrivibrio sp. OR37]
MEKNSRIDNSLKNIKIAYIAQIINVLLSFISRTIFIKYLGMEYLGISGLFSNVLGILSLAELGFGTAMNYTLYKPVSENDSYKIGLLLDFYRKTYRKIAILVFMLGVGIIPILHLIIEVPSNVGNVYIYYFIYLLNTILSYFVSYQFCLTNAEQKVYINTLFDMVLSITTNVVQIVCMIIYKNFIFYLLIGLFLRIIQKICIQRYFNVHYPFIKEKRAAKIQKDDLDSIKKNVKGLVWHKLGEVAIHQTDNIIIAGFLSIIQIGIVDNYNMIINAVSMFVTIIFNNITPSLGNKVAADGREETLKIYKVYELLNYWIYGFCSLALLFLFQPFIKIWIGGDKLIDSFSLILICLNFYFSGRRISFLNYKTVYGVFYDDKYVVLFSATLNLIISIIAGKILGLPGIYLGTLVSGLYQSIRRPIISYERITGESVKIYFSCFIKDLVRLAPPMIVVLLLTNVLIQDITYIRFVIMAIIYTIMVNIWFYLCLQRTDEFKYIKIILVTKLKTIKLGRENGK